MAKLVGKCCCNWSVKRDCSAFNAKIPSTLRFLSIHTIQAEMMTAWPKEKYLGAHLLAPGAAKFRFKNFVALLKLSENIAEFFH